jgi:DNA-binding PadR family transcriptional regulator
MRNDSPETPAPGAPITTVTNAELAVLGLLAETPRHGYEIEQVIELRGMRAWTEVGFSSIYHVLNKLEAAGWLASEKQPVNERLRKVYHLTPPGWAVYQAAVQQRLQSPRPHSGDLELALANLPALPPTLVLTALESNLAGLRLRLTQVQTKWDGDGRGHLPPHVEALFGYSVAMMCAEMQWLEGYLNIPPAIKNDDQELQWLEGFLKTPPESE